MILNMHSLEKSILDELSEYFLKWNEPFSADFSRSPYHFHWCLEDFDGRRLSRKTGWTPKLAAPKRMDAVRIVTEQLF